MDLNWFGSGDAGKVDQLKGAPSVHRRPSHIEIGCWFEAKAAIIIGLAQNDHEGRASLTANLEPRHGERLADAAPLQLIDDSERRQAQQCSVERGFGRNAAKATIADNAIIVFCDQFARHGFVAPQRVHQSCLIVAAKCVAQHRQDRAMIVGVRRPYGERFGHSVFEPVRFALFEEGRNAFLALGAGAGLGDHHRGLFHDRVAERAIGDLADQLLGEFL